MKLTAEDINRPQYPASPRLVELYRRLLEVCDELVDLSDSEPRAGVLHSGLVHVLNASNNNPSGTESALLRGLARDAAANAKLAEAHEQGDATLPIER